MLRAWYNGSTKASQALDEGSIPFARTIRLRLALRRDWCSQRLEKRMLRRNEMKASQMFYVYILQSIEFPWHFYVGCTSDLKRRMYEHNHRLSTHTKKYVPWKIKNYIAFENECTAKLFEQYLKTCSGRRFIKKHLE